MPANPQRMVVNWYTEDAFISINQDWGSSGAWAGIAFEAESRGETLIYRYLGMQIPEKSQALFDKSGDSYALLSYEVAHEYFRDYMKQYSCCY